MICPNCKSEMEVQHVCEHCGERKSVMEITGGTDIPLGDVVDTFVKSGDTAALNQLFDAYEPLITAEKESGLRLGEWNKLKADIRGLAIAIMKAYELKGRQDVESCEVNSGINANPDMEYSKGRFRE